GRLEVQGAMWVEADTNIPSGESLIRQLFYGKEFFRNEFGREMNYLWEPDVFGYSASLPQILKKSGVDYFITQKLSWNLINKYPNHSFKWKGIDGSEVLTHLLPEETYNGPASPGAVVKIEQNYLDKGISDQCLMAFGIGDGGGGPGAEHLERLKRMKNLAGLCPVEQRTVADFLTIWEKDKEGFASWDGELYLERHQGTFTTQCKSKWYNRRMEIRLRELEWKAVLSGLVSETKYPAESLERIWKEVLLYQFHDILPGSSIKRVYEESLGRYAFILKETEGLISNHESSFIKNIDTSNSKKPYVIQNSLSWDREEWVKVENTWGKILVPAMGYVVIDGVSVGSFVSNQPIALADKLENEFLAISFNDDGSIKSIIDKEFHQEILSPAGMGNCISIYEDDGDAWDFSLNYREKKTDSFVLMSSETEIDGPKASITHFYEYKKSEMKQQIILTQGSRRIDFITWINWREPAKMIKTGFPLAIKADHAVCEIQFGSIKRPTHSNTTLDMAKDEVPAQKWVDISSRHYGVALLNDSKYGHRVKDNALELTLVRCVRYPGPLIDKSDSSGSISGDTDLGEHNFTYSLYPHSGDYAE
ncbi:MAG: alpha-mannosidase, partial [Spirochaetales bacterium]|nr:alpha-mannosidase [Spirochaetales bacterium]